MLLTKKEFLDYKKLLQKKYRQERKMFIIEGKHLIEEAIKHKNIIKTIITSDKTFNVSNVDIKYCTYEQICLLSTTKTPQEYIAICNFFEFKNIISNVVLVLNKINDPGNLGTIIRTAFSFGVTEIIVEGVDIYNSKVLRSTQGSIFNVNIRNVKNLIDELNKLKNQNYKIVGSLLEGARDYNNFKVDNKDKIAIVLGNEANGIQKEVIDLLDYKIYIPIKFESLNVAVACGILLSKLTNIKE